MARQGGWLINAPTPRPTLRVETEPPSAFALLERDRNARMERRTATGRKMRRLTQLSTSDLRAQNTETASDRAMLRRERKAQILARIADMEARNEARDAATLAQLKWHLKTYLSD